MQKKKLKQSGAFVKQLIKSFDKKKFSNPSYSWRSLAAEIGVSHVFLLNVLSGKSRFPIIRIDNLVKSLDLDDMAERSMLQGLIDDSNKHLAKKSKALTRFINDNVNSPAPNSQVIYPADFEEVEPEKATFFRYWYVPAVLDLAATVDFKLDFNWIAKKLKITSFEAKWAWDLLLRENLVKKNLNGNWSKTKNHLRVASKTSTLEMRQFYSQMLKKTESIMINEKNDNDFQNRFIFGLTCSSHQKSWPRLKQKLGKQLLSNGLEFSKGNCDSVYYLMTIAIPLATKKTN